MFGDDSASCLTCNHRAGPDLYLLKIIDATTTNGNENTFLTSVTDMDGRIPTTLAIESQVQLHILLLLYFRHPIAYEVLQFFVPSDINRNGNKRRGDSTHTKNSSDSLEKKTSRRRIANVVTQHTKYALS